MTLDSETLLRIAAFLFAAGFTVAMVAVWLELTQRSPQ
jgi:hypothetical protein